MVISTTSYIRQQGRECRDWILQSLCSGTSITPPKVARDGEQPRLESSWDLMQMTEDVHLLLLVGKLVENNCHFLLNFGESDHFVKK